MPIRAAIFIDGSNFFKNCEELRVYTYQMEWDRFLEDLVRGREIVYARYYDCPKREGDKGIEHQVKRQKLFFSLLRKIPWMRLVFGRLEMRHKDDGAGYLVEKGVDVNIAVDMVLGAVRDEYDHAFLLSADADYVPAIRAVQEIGKRVLVATPGKSYHLGQVADVFVRLDALRLASFLRRHGGP